MYICTPYSTYKGDSGAPESLCVKIMHVADKISLNYYIVMIRKTAHMDIYQYKNHN